MKAQVLSWWILGPIWVVEGIQVVSLSSIGYLIGFMYIIVSSYVHPLRYNIGLLQYSKHVDPAPI